MEKTESDSVEKIDSACKAAAEAIKNADILLVATGAGFSADSGLAVYKDIADVDAYNKKNLTYSDLCRPSWLQTDADLFFGFWGSCFNSYRITDPHQGYKIVKKWKETLFQDKPIKKKIQEAIKERSSSQYPGKTKTKTLEETLADLNLSDDPLAAYPGAFFVYTSNVDNHSIKCGFKQNEVYEIHGTTEYWQCSKKCKDEYWQAPADYTFQVDSLTMKSENSPSGCQEKGFEKNHPTCKFCDALARPAVLMFGDSGWVDDPIQCRIYSSWKKSVFNLLTEDSNLKIAIVEIGCGIRVPTVRYQTENYVEALESCTLIRINPDYPLYDGRNLKGKVISVQSKGLEAIKKIDLYMNDKQ